jgi:hypothetical protein
MIESSFDGKEPVLDFRPDVVGPLSDFRQRKSPARDGAVIPYGGIA